MGNKKGNRAANHSGSISKKIEQKDGKKYVSWRARYSLPDGTQREKKFPSAEEAQSFLNQTLADIQNDDYLEPSLITVGQWLDTYLDEYTANLKPLTKKSYTAQINTHIKPALGKYKLSSLNTPQIQRFINSLSKTGKKTVKKDKDTGKEIVSCSPLAPKSVKNVHGVLLKALSTAVDVGFLKNNPAERITLPRASKPEMHPLDKSQMGKYLAAASQDDYGYLLRILPLTGLRESEALGLTWDCVDFNAGTITVSKQLIKLPKVDGGFMLDTTKSGRTRVIKPAPLVMQLLEERQKEQEADRTKAGEFWQGYQTDREKKTALVFTTRAGTHLHPQTVYNHLKKVLRSIGVTESCVHDLRHTYATLGLQLHDDIKTVSSNLGHSTSSFTLDRYGHVTDSMRDDSSRRWQELIETF